MLPAADLGPGEGNSPCPMSEPGRREDIDIVSACALRDAVVRTDVSLDFFESGRGSLKNELLDVDDQTLAVSLPRSFDPDLRPVARRRRLATPDDADTFELIEIGRVSTWKLDSGREVAKKMKGYCHFEQKNDEEPLHRSGVVPPFPGRGRAGVAGTTGVSTGTAALFAKRSNKFWRRIRYSSSLTKE